MFNSFPELTIDMSGSETYFDQKYLFLTSSSIAINNFMINNLFTPENKHIKLEGMVGRRVGSRRRNIKLAWGYSNCWSGAASP